jgi:hypothetical protein
VTGSVVDNTHAETSEKSMGERLTGLAQLLGPTTLLTALLYYYGYVSLKAYYAYFGITLTVVDPSPADYIVRSPDTLFRPVATLMGILVIAYLAHRAFAALCPRIGTIWLRRIAVVLLGLTIVLAVIGVSGLYADPRGLLSPLSLTAAALLLEYTLWVLLTFADPTPAAKAFLEGGVLLRRGLVVAVVIVGAFWTVSLLAQDRGRSNAELTEISLPIQPQAIVYSTVALELHGPGVNEVRLGSEHGSFTYRYSGLHTLLFANDRWFLLPHEWSAGSGATVFILRDDPSKIRIDVGPVPILR